MNLPSSEKQTNLERIREKLAAQMKARVDDEDSRIRRAVEEAEAKQAKDDAEREERARRMIQEASEHRVAMVSSVFYHQLKVAFKLEEILQQPSNKKFHARYSCSRFSRSYRCYWDQRVDYDHIK